MQDEEKTVIQTLYIFIIFALIASTLAFIVSLITSPGPLTADGQGGLVGIITCLVVFWLMRIKQFIIPRIILPSVVYLIATYFIFTGPTIGIRDDAILLYALAVALAGLLLSNKGVIVFGILSFIAVESSIYLEINGFLVNHITEHTTNYATLVTVGVTYSLTFAMMYILVSILTRNLTKMRSDQQALAQANQELQSIRASLELKIQERTTAAEIARSEAEAARKMAETQVWLVTGQAQLAEQMRGDLSITTLADNIVRHICHYTGAQAGIFFLVTGETLHLTGRYAYTERPGAKTTIRIGEGLIGQAARENTQLILYQIPPDALRIASSLGESLPRQLLIASLEIAGRVIGVLELATLNQFTTEHQAFIAHSSESIAIAFQTAQTRERVSSLLFDTQQQAEELQAQEEEIRKASNQNQP